VENSACSGDKDATADPGFMDRVDANVVELGGASGVEPRKVDPFASDRRPWSEANPMNTTSLSVLATPLNMDHQS
jgi:hypothetical protein